MSKNKTLKLSGNKITVPLYQGMPVTPGSGWTGEMQTGASPREMKATIEFTFKPGEYFDPEQRLKGPAQQLFALECVEEMVQHMTDFPMKYTIKVECEGSVMEKEIEEGGILPPESESNKS